MAGESYEGILTEFLGFDLKNVPTILGTFRVFSTARRCLTCYTQTKQYFSEN